MGGEPEPEAEAVLAELYEVIEQRKRELPEDSYTASLFTHEKGQNRALEKLGEETTELVLAAKDDEDVAGEAADLVYHMLVVLSMREVGLEELLGELRARR